MQCVGKTARLELTQKVYAACVDHVQLVVTTGMITSSQSAKCHGCQKINSAATFDWKSAASTTTVEENHSTSSTSTHTGLPVSPPVTRGVVRDSASTNDVSLPNGAIIGIVIGVLLVALILAALFIYIVKTRQPPLNNGVEETGQPSEHRVQVRSQK